MPVERSVNQTNARLRQPLRLKTREFLIPGILGYELWFNPRLGCVYIYLCMIVCVCMWVYVWVCVCMWVCVCVSIDSNHRAHIKNLKTAESENKNRTMDNADNKTIIKTIPLYKNVLINNKIKYAYNMFYLKVLNTQLQHSIF